MWKLPGSGSAPGTRLALSASAWSALLLAAALFWPAYRLGGTRVEDGRIVSFNSSATLVAVNGPRVLAVVAVPLLASLACYLALRMSASGSSAWPRRTAMACLGMVALECLVAIASVGLFMLPTALLLWAGVWARPRA